MVTRKSGPLDAMVGERIRMLRVNRGISQAMFAGQIGVTFQQVQKYERGADRVGASRLSQIASVLGVSIGELFESSRIESARLDSPMLVEPGALHVESTAARNPRTKATVARLHAVDRGERRRSPSRG